MRATVRMLDAATCLYGTKRDAIDERYKVTIKVNSDDVLSMLFLAMALILLL